MNAVSTRRTSGASRWIATDWCIDTGTQRVISSPATRTWWSVFANIIRVYVDHTSAQRKGLGIVFLIKQNTQFYGD